MGTNNRIVVDLDVSAISDAISRIGSVLDGNGALPPTVEVKDISHCAAKVVIKPHDDEKECVGHKLVYMCGTDGDDEKMDWQVIDDIVDNGGEVVEYELKSLQKATR